MILPGIVSTSERENVPIKIVLFGKSGSGKTCTAATAPAPLFLDSEGGTLPLARADVARKPTKTLREAIDVLKWLAADPEPRAYWKTLVIDSVSDLAERELAHALTVTANGKPPDGRAVYGDLATRFLDFFRLVRELPYFHVVCVAKMATREDGVTHATYYGPSMPGQKLAEALPYIFDGSYCVHVKPDRTRVLLCQTAFQHDTKDRSGGALSAEEPLNLTHIFDKIATFLTIGEKNG